MSSFSLANDYSLSPSLTPSPSISPISPPSVSDGTKSYSILPWTSARNNRMDPNALPPPRSGESYKCSPRSSRRRSHLSRERACSPERHVFVLKCTPTGDRPFLRGTRPRSREMVSKVRPSGTKVTRVTQGPGSGVERLGYVREGRR